MTGKKPIPDDLMVRESPGRLWMASIRATESFMADQKHIETLARAAFQAQERVRLMAMANTPTDYDEREKAFIALAEARRVAAEATWLLNLRIGQWRVVRAKEANLNDLESADIWRRLLNLGYSQDEAHQWMFNPHPQLRGSVAADCAHDEVVAILDRLESGAYL
jgi:uncharacterized protein (DUF2384 family)